MTQQESLPSPANTRIDRVGFIGLGEMGTPIAAHVLRRHASLKVYNRTTPRMRPLLDQGATGCSSPRKLGEQTELILLCLFDAEATESVLFGPDGVMTAARPGQLIVDLSTAHPGRTRSIAKRAHELGVRWVDAPVSGGPQGALAGTLAVMAGGAEDDIRRIKPVLASFASQVTHVGPTGCGQIAKACNQMINFGNAAAIAEAMNLAARLGLDPRCLPQALAGGFADSALLRHIGPKMANGTVRGNSAMTMKDMEIALDLGRSANSAMPVTELIGSIFRQLLAQGRTQDGIGGIARFYTDDSFAEEFGRLVSKRR